MSPESTRSPLASSSRSFAEGLVNKPEKGIDVVRDPSWEAHLVSPSACSAQSRDDQPGTITARANSPFSSAQ
jgi:hypothetical protein